MSRVQAADYGDKKKAIMDAAAALFAEVGYPGAQLKQVAQKCGATKSMLYHYFPSKDELLFALLSEHLQQTIEAIAQIDRDVTPEQHLRTLVEIYIQKSAETRSRHIVAMNDVKYLSPSLQKKVLELERTLLRQFEKAVKGLDSSLPTRLVGPYAMMLSGLLNWTDLWYHASGSVKPKELCDRLTGLFLRGFDNRAK